MPAAVVSTATVSKPTKELITYHLRPPAWRLPLLEESEGKDAASREAFPGFFPGASALFADWIGSSDNTARNTGHFAGVNRDVSTGQTGIVGENLAKEDDLSDTLVKSGFVGRTPVQTEAFSAHGLIHQRLQSGASLTALSKIVNKVIERRGGIAFSVKSVRDEDAGRDHTATPSHATHPTVLPMIGPWTYKAPTKVVYNDARREAWFAELSNPAIPLGKLAKSIPNLPTVSTLPSVPTSPVIGLSSSPQSRLRLNESYPSNRAAGRHLEILLDRQVPLDRAKWYLCAVAQADQAQSSKASLRTSINPGNITGPTSLGLAFSADLSIACVEALSKLLSELTHSLTHGTALTLNRPAFHVRGRPKNILADEASREAWQTRWSYVTDFIRVGLSDSVLDGVILTRGIVALLSGAHIAQMPMVTPLVLHTALPRACRDLYSARCLVECVLSCSRSLDTFGDPAADAATQAMPDVKNLILRDCKYILSVLSNCVPEALFKPLLRNVPIGYGMLRDALRTSSLESASDILHSMDTAGGHAPLIHYLADTCTQEQFAGGLPRPTTSRIPTDTLAAILRLLDESDARESVSNLAKSIRQCSSSMVTATELVQVLCLYATSDFRFGRHRPFLIGCILKEMLIYFADRDDTSVEEGSPDIRLSRWRVARGIYLWLDSRSAASDLSASVAIICLLRHFQATNVLEIAALAQFVLPTCQTRGGQSSKRNAFFGYIFRNINMELLAPAAAFQVARIAAFYHEADIVDQKSQIILAEQQLRYDLRNISQLPSLHIVTVMDSLAGLGMFDDLMRFIEALCAQPQSAQLVESLLSVRSSYSNVWLAGGFDGRWHACCLSMLECMTAAEQVRSPPYKRLLKVLLEMQHYVVRPLQILPDAALSALAIAFHRYKESIARPCAVPSPDWHADLRNEVTHQILAICLAQDDMITKQLADHFWLTYGHLSYWIDGIMTCILTVAIQSLDTTAIAVLAALTRALDPLTLDDVYKAISTCLRSDDMMTQIKYAASSSIQCLCALLFELNASHLYGEAGFLTDIVAPISAVALSETSQPESYERLQALCKCVLARLKAPKAPATMILRHAVEPHLSIDTLLDLFVEWRRAKLNHGTSGNIVCESPDPVHILFNRIVQNDTFKVNFLMSPAAHCAYLLPGDSETSSSAIAQLDVLDAVLEATIAVDTSNHRSALHGKPANRDAIEVDTIDMIPWFVELKKYKIEGCLRRFNLEASGQEAGAGYVRGLLTDLCNNAVYTSAFDDQQLAAFSGSAAIQFVHEAFACITELLADISHLTESKHQLQILCGITRKVLADNTTFEASGELRFFLSGAFLSTWTEAAQNIEAKRTQLALSSVLEVMCLAVRLHHDIWVEQQDALVVAALRLLQLVLNGDLNSVTAVAVADVAILLVDCTLGSTDLMPLQAACTKFRSSTSDITLSQQRLLSLFPSQASSPGANFLRTTQGDLVQPYVRWQTGPLTGPTQIERRQLVTSNNASIDLAAVGTRILELTPPFSTAITQASSDVKANSFDSETPSYNESVWMKDYRRSVAIGLDSTPGSGFGTDSAAQRGAEALEVSAEQSAGTANIPVVKIEDTQADLQAAAAIAAKKTQQKKRKSTPGVAAEDASPKRRKVSSKTTSKRKP